MSSGNYLMNSSTLGNAFSGLLRYLALQDDKISSKQDKLIAGSNITINGNIISSTGGGGGGGVTTFSAGTTGFTPVAPTAGAVTLGGVLNVVNGGTGLSTVPTNGQVLIGNGAGYTVASITAGSGISITNGVGSITINNTGIIDDPFPKILMLMGG